MEDIQKQLRSGVLTAVERIEELIKKEKIVGYKGLLIDNLEFNPKLSFAFDIAAKGISHYL